MKRLVVFSVLMLSVVSGSSLEVKTAAAAERWMCRVVAEHMPIVAYGNSQQEAIDNLQRAFRNQYPNGAMTVQEPRTCKQISQ